MTRTWLYRILRGTAASFLVGAVLGGLETAFALRSSITEMVHALHRLQLWGLNVLMCGALGAVIGLAVSAAVGSVAGSTPELRALAAETERDPRHSWLPWVLGASFGGVLLAQIAPWALAERSEGLGPLSIGLVVVGAAAVSVGLRLWLREVDTTGRGAALAFLGLPVVLVLTMSFAVSAPLAGGKGSATRAQEGTPNVLLVTVDGLRTDHVGQGARVRTPALSWLGKKGVRFTQVSTASTADGPAVAALLTGRHPLSTGFVADGQRLPEQVPGSGKPLKTLAEELREEGYATGAFVSSASLDGRDSGLARGFDVYDDGIGERRPGIRRLALPTLRRWMRSAGGRTLGDLDVLRPSAETLVRFERWLAYHYRQNFFAWVHLADPRLPLLAGEMDPSSLVDPLPGDKGRAYGARVALQDAILAELFEALEDDGILGWTVVVVAGTRGYLPGGQPTVDEPWIQVPALMYGPGLEGPLEVEEQVRLHDLAPTLLSVVGYRRTRMGDAVSLVPALEGKSLGSLEVLATSPPREDGRCAVTLRTPEAKYVRSAAGRSSWYLLEEDPKELSDATEEQPEEARAVGDRLTETLGREVPLAVIPPLDPGRSADLRTLKVTR